MNTEEFAQFQARLEPIIAVSLVRRGASHAQAQDIVRDILGDCAKPGEESLLNKFKSGGNLEAWITRVAINRLIDQQRRNKFREEIDEHRIESIPDSPENTEPLDDSLAQLIAQAISHSYQKCSSQEKVLLWLAYAHRVDQRRIAKAWQWSDSKISRKLSRIRETMQECILAYVRDKDPHASVTWNDILSLSLEHGMSLIPKDPANP